jgi:hypothetical protein
MHTSVNYTSKHCCQDNFGTIMLTKYLSVDISVYRTSIDNIIIITVPNLKLRKPCLHIRRHSVLGLGITNTQQVASNLAHTQLSKLDESVRRTGLQATPPPPPHPLPQGTNRFNPPPPPPPPKYFGGGKACLYPGSPMACSDHEICTRGGGGRPQ